MPQTCEKEQYCGCFSISCPVLCWQSCETHLAWPIFLIEGCPRGITEPFKNQLPVFQMHSKLHGATNFWKEGRHDLCKQSICKDFQQSKKNGFFQPSLPNQYKLGRKTEYYNCLLMSCGILLKECWNNHKTFVCSSPAWLMTSSCSYWRQ